MKAYVAVLLAVVMFITPCAVAATKQARQLEIKPGAVSVTVKNHDGKALPRAALKLMSLNGRPTRRFVTDAKGRCTLTALKLGAYKLLVADRAVVRFVVRERAKVTTLLVVLPPPAKYAAGDPVKRAVKAPPLLVWVLGGMAFAGAGYMVTRDDDSTGGGDGHP